MIIKQLIDEDFVNYKKPSMFIGFPSCSWKCDKECGMQVCQNGALANSPDINIDIDDLCLRYIKNKITTAIVCAGLEPMDNFNNLCQFIFILRSIYECNDDVVIYTGYTKEECINKGWIETLSLVENIIIKFGRYIPNQEKHFDDVLGICLASDNQYAERLS